MSSEALRLVCQVVVSRSLPNDAGSLPLPSTFSNSSIDAHTKSCRGRKTISASPSITCRSSNHDSAPRFSGGAFDDDKEEASLSISSTMLSVLSPSLKLVSIESYATATPPRAHRCAIRTAIDLTGIGSKCHDASFTSHASGVASKSVDRTVSDCVDSTRTKSIQS